MIVTICFCICNASDQIIAESYTWHESCVTDSQCCLQALKTADFANYYVPTGNFPKNSLKYDHRGEYLATSSNLLLPKISKDNTSVMWNIL